jgi:hypothetical protein
MSYMIRQLTFSVDDSQLVATRPDTRHRTRMGQAKRFAALQAPQQKTGFDSRVRAERRRLDLPAQPGERLVAGTH